MARSAATDLLNSMRFHVISALAENEGVDILQPDSEGLADRAQAGFTSVTVPELTIEATEYKEGTMNLPRKYAGAPTVGDVSLSRGVARADTSFWRWARRAVEGNGQYRADLTINHYGREAARPGGIDPNTAVPQRQILVKEGIPTRCKPAGDLDATSADISVAECDVACEDIDIRVGPAPRFV